MLISYPQYKINITQMLKVKSLNCINKTAMNERCSLDMFKYQQKKKHLNVSGRNKVSRFPNIDGI